MSVALKKIVTIGIGQSGRAIIRFKKHIDLIFELIKTLSNTIYFHFY